MITPSKPRCDECEFYQKGSNDEGFCCAHPPKVFFAAVPRMVEGKMVPILEDTTGWPTVPGNAWCGEYKKAFQLASH